MNVLADRILDSFPSGSYALSAFLRLVDVVETVAVPTAAVECRQQPRLLINPAFVAAHAGTSEQLLMLVMHELHHVLLGHTTLFPRATRAQNFVFDAVINGLCCRMFPQSAHTSFFSGYYSEDRFPECLLRPPPGWPAHRREAAAITALPEGLRERASDLHRALYSHAGASYAEVYQVLPSLVEKAGGTGLETVPLLGDHGSEDQVAAAQLQAGAPLLFDIVRSLVEQWPQPPDPIRGRSLADLLESGRFQLTRRPSHRAILRRLLRKVAGQGAAGRVLQRVDDHVAYEGAVPVAARRSFVLRALGGTVLLHPASFRQPRQTPSGERVHVYLDVSGSMDSVLPALYGAVLDVRERVHPQLHLFSTRVSEISIDDLRAGLRRSTGGTDIGCVARHMEVHRVRRALLVTDGWVGKPAGTDRQTLERCRLAVAYLGGNTHTADLEAVTDFAAHLSA